MSSGLHNPPLSEADTRSKLIDPAIYARGWTEEHIRREETAGAIENISGEWRRRSRGRVDYTLRLKVSAGKQPVAVAVVEAKAENLPPTHGLEQAKSYARCQRLNVGKAALVACPLIAPRRPSYVHARPAAGCLRTDLNSLVQ